ncbi:MAG: cation diffusion facilitator family transporter [Aphanocapsa lilacina HA4352-LM1]|jgi:cobalt-zinc-cadmium efflux system protein|nr:cation diffusion facilitator family transporter [Aphanocapsa lilacina HA4352-LM1]
MGSGHVHAPANYNRAFAVGIALNVGFVVIEAVYGILAGSLALLADAGHNLSDVLGLALAWGASVLTTRHPSPRRTYGLRRSSILAALLNAVTLLVAVGAIAWEAVIRLQDPGPVAGGTIIWVAAVGVLVNSVSAYWFVKGQADLNVRGAFLHLASDAAVSLGTVFAGAAILLTGWTWLDPVVSLAIGVVIVVGTWGLLVDSLNLALDAVPEGIDPEAVKTYLQSLRGVGEVHDLHIWAMSTTETALTAHLVIPGGPPGDAFLAATCRHLHDRFGIEHATLQIETGDPAHPCCLAPDTRV